MLMDTGRTERARHHLVCDIDLVVRQVQAFKMRTKRLPYFNGVLLSSLLAMYLTCRMPDYSDDLLF